MYYTVLPVLIWTCVMHMRTLYADRFTITRDSESAGWQVLVEPDTETEEACQLTQYS